MEWLPLSAAPVDLQLPECIWVTVRTLRKGWNRQIDGWNAYKWLKWSRWPSTRTARATCPALNELRRQRRERQRRRRIKRRGRLLSTIRVHRCTLRWFRPLRRLAWSDGSNRWLWSVLPSKPTAVRDERCAPRTDNKFWLRAAPMFIVKHEQKTISIVFNFSKFGYNLRKGNQITFEYTTLSRIAAKLIDRFWSSSFLQTK